MRKEQKTEITKEKIMILAIREFGEKGYHDASLNNICAQGISKGLLYHNFEHKDALYLACVKRCLHHLMQYLDHPEYTDDIHHYLNARLHFFHEYEDETRLFFETILQPPIHLKDTILKERDAFDQMNKKIYEQMLKGVTLRKDVTKAEAMDYFTLMQSMFNGFFSSPAYKEMRFQDVIYAHEKSVSKMLDYMLYGIAERKDN